MAFLKPVKKDNAQLSDEEIVEQILAGQQHLLELLYDRYSARVFHKCLSIVKDREMSKDLTHDILVKVFTNLVKFKGKSAFSLWVHSITYNYCIDYLKKQKKLRFNDIDSVAYENIADDQYDIEDKLLTELKLSQLNSLFDRLDPDEKIILMMRYQDDMPVKDIATTLEISESAAKMRLKRVRDQLAVLLEKMPNDE